ncbi:MAG: hypothetical protein ACKO37_09130 [Vampirovibrionales bacterium]
MAINNTGKAVLVAVAGLGAVAGGLKLGELFPMGKKNPQNTTSQVPNSPVMPKNLKEANPVKLSQTAQLAQTEKTALPGFKTTEACKKDATCTLGAKAVNKLIKDGNSGVEPPLDPKTKITAARRLDPNSYQYETSATAGNVKTKRQFVVTNPDVQEQKVVELEAGKQPVLQIPGDATAKPPVPANRKALTFGDKTKIAATNDTTYELIDTTNVKGTSDLRRALGKFALTAEYGRSRQAVLSSAGAKANQKPGTGSVGTNFAGVPVKQGDGSGSIVALEQPNGQVSFKLYWKDPDTGRANLVKNDNKETFESLEALLKEYPDLEANQPQASQ